MKMILEYRNREMNIEETYGIDVEQLKVITEYLPQVEERMEYVFPDYVIMGIEILDTPTACDQFISITCVNENNRITIEKHTDIWYECGRVCGQKLLKDPEERRKYLEGSYIFKDFPWGLNIEAKIDLK